MQYKYDEEAQRYFSRVYNRENNFMTPNVLYRQIFGKYAIELSTDDRRNLFGVTVLEIDNGVARKTEGFNRAFDSLLEASNYVSKLTEG